MYQDPLFAEVPVSKGPHRISLREISVKMKTVVVREDAPSWVTKRFTMPSQVFEMFRDLYEETKEQFITLHLNGKNEILCKEIVSIGSLNQSVVHPREVFKTAMITNAAAIMFIHNHPSGDSRPSGEDISITKRLAEAGSILGIKVLDHIVIGNNEYTSFVEAGLM